MEITHKKIYQKHLEFMKIKNNLLELLHDPKLTMKQKNELKQELKKCQAFHKEIQKEMKEFTKAEMDSWKNSIPSEIWNSPLFQNYLGIYQNQKGPYHITSITPYDDTVLLTANTSEVLPCIHHSYYHNAKLDIIILKSLPEGFFRYYGREFTNPEDEVEGYRFKTTYSLEDMQKRKYQIETFQNRTKGFVRSKMKLSSKDCYYLAQSFQETNQIPEEIQRIAQKNQQDTFLQINLQPYFKVLEEQAAIYPTSEIFRKVKKRMN